MYFLLSSKSSRLLPWKKGQEISFWLLKLHCAGVYISALGPIKHLQSNKTFIPTFVNNLYFIIYWNCQFSSLMFFFKTIAFINNVCLEKGLEQRDQLIVTLSIYLYTQTNKTFLFEAHIVPDKLFIAELYLYNFKLGEMFTEGVGRRGKGFYLFSVSDKKISMFM